jgi:hypothetical protein
MSHNIRKYQWSETGAGGAGGDGHTHEPQSAVLTRDANGAVETVTSIGIDLVQGDTWTLSRNPNESIASLTNAGGTTPPSDWLIKWDATTSDGIEYLTDEETNDISKWNSQEGPEELGFVVMSESSVDVDYPEWVQDTDGHPCVHFQDDGCVWRSSLSTSNPDIYARIDDASDITIFVVCMLNDPTAKGGNTFCFVGPNGFRCGNSGLDDSIDLHWNGDYRTSTNGWEDRRVICSARNKHNDTNDNDCECWIGKDSLYSATSQADVLLQGYNAITMGSYSNGSSSSWDIDCNIYEVIVFGRTLTDIEHANVVDSLSYKWQATNADNAVDTISEAPLGPYYLVTVDRDVDGIIEGVTATVV